MRVANHYVAKSYQTRFCDAEGLIWVFDKETGDARPQPPKCTAVENHLYTVETEDGSKSDILEEKVFDPLDGLIAPLISKWIEPGYCFNYDEKLTMAYYLAFQHARVPRNLGMIKEYGEIMAKKMLKDVSADKAIMDDGWEYLKSKFDDLGDFSRDKLQSGFENVENLGFELVKDFVLSMSIKVNVPIFYEALASMKWSIVDAPPDNFFVTCDAPAVSMAFISPRVLQLGCNLASPLFEMIYPLSPTVCVWIGKFKHLDRSVCTPDQVDDFNYRSSLMAERYILAHQDSASTRELLKMTSKTRYRPKIDKEVLHKRLDFERPKRTHSF